MTDNSEKTKVDVYTTTHCPFCHAAKQLLKSKNIPFNAIDISGDSADEGEDGSLDTVEISAEELGGALGLAEEVSLEDAGSAEDLLSLDLAGEESGTGGEELDLSLEFGTDGAESTEEGGLDLDLGAVEDDGAETPVLELDEAEADEEDAETTQFMLPDVSAGAESEDDDKTLVLGAGLSGEVDEIKTKLELAEAYIEMGDGEGAKGILGEILTDGSKAQQEAAQALLARIGA